MYYEDNDSISFFRGFSAPPAIAVPNDYVVLVFLDVWFSNGGMIIQFFLNFDAIESLSRLASMRTEATQGIKRKAVGLLTSR